MQGQTGGRVPEKVGLKPGMPRLRQGEGREFRGIKAQRRKQYWNVRRRQLKNQPTVKTYREIKLTHQ